MTDKQLNKFVKDFTKGILGKRKPKMMCFAVCAPLQELLRMSGFEVQLIKGEINNGGEIWEHYWLMTKDGKIIDPTAGQFLSPTGDLMPDILIGEKPEWYKINN